jgi:hypothetical protein
VYPTPCPGYDDLITTLSAPIIVDRIGGLEAAIVGTNAGEYAAAGSFYAASSSF